MIKELKLYDERMGRLFEAGLGGFWMVNPDDVNLDDLMESHRPGAIVRVRDMSSIRFISAGDQELAGCIAGWISEEE